MPLRRKNNKPSKHVTLDEALNWIAFDNFNGPELTDNEVQIGIFGDCDNLEAIEIAQWQRSQNLDAAKMELFSALRDGDIWAFGFRGMQWHSGTPWQQRHYSQHSDEREQIPPDFWRLDGVKWGENIAKGTSAEFVEIILERKSVVDVWALDDDGSNVAAPTDNPTPASSRGRRPAYRESEFFALCAWEASLNGLPDTMAEFVRTMSELLAVSWGEEKTPGETWLKEKIRAIYDRKIMYEKGRQLVVGAEISAAE